jgi:hypothetical protein
MSTDLSSPQVRAQLAKMLNSDVAATSVRDFEEGPRTHLGASIMGEACKRKPWGVFRHLRHEKHSGRMHRLFKRGHREEPHFIERLRAVGFEIFEHDPATGKQFRIVGARGHYGGSGDGMGYAPPAYGIVTPGVVEFKTHNEKSFAKLAGKIQTKVPDIVRVNPEGVRKSKPMHFAQMCQYGRAYGLTWGLYCAINKETDEYYFEWVELDWTLADRLFRDAEYIVGAQVPPPKIAESIAFFDCKYCAQGSICHAGAKPDVNCRSCIHAFAVDNGEWFCEVHNGIIPKDFIPKACPQWQSIV